MLIISKKYFFFTNKFYSLSSFHEFHLYPQSLIKQFFISLPNHLFFFLLNIYCFLSIQLSTIALVTEWNDIVAFSHRIVHSCGRGIIVFTPPHKYILSTGFAESILQIDIFKLFLLESTKSNFIFHLCALSVVLKQNKHHFIFGLR